ncbi:MAG: PqqD family protein [Acutalibacteraceae bacterium]|nr:PqqD family protein [Acutalibacteraceae bacterium]
MKIKEGFILRTVAGQNLVVPTGNNTMNFNAAITLNESASFLWRLLGEEKSEEELISLMTEEYDIDEATAKTDIKVFLNVLKEHNILE